MLKNVFLALMMVVGTGIYSLAADEITFDSNSMTMMGDPVVLKGNLTKPQGDGPFPAVVMLHPCPGPMPEYEETWVDRFTSWGYVTFRVDSFGPRGESSVCVKLLAVPPWDRAQDAHDANS